MRTKTLLLSAAAMVAGLLSSQAQSNVYSANIVGYVTVTNAANAYALYALPLDSGSNNLTGLFPNAANTSQVLIWNGAGYQTAQKSFGTWNTNFNLVPGQGFFVKFPANGTNTFVGSIIVPNGGSVTNSFAANLYTLVGSPIPYTDNLTGTNLNLNILPNTSQVLVWTGSGFQTAQKSFGSWNTNLTIVPGQGFFVKSAVNTNWVQTLIVQ